MKKSILILLVSIFTISFISCQDDSVEPKPDYTKLMDKLEVKAESWGGTVSAFDDDGYAGYDIDLLYPKALAMTRPGGDFEAFTISTYNAYTLNGVETTMRLRYMSIKEAYTNIEKGQCWVEGEYLYHNSLGAGSDEYRPILVTYYFAGGDIMNIDNWFLDNYTLY